MKFDKRKGVRHDERLSLAFGPARLLKIRERRDLTQMDLARIIGANQSSVSAWEAGLRLPTKPEILERLIALEQSAR